MSQPPVFSLLLEFQQSKKVVSFPGETMPPDDLLTVLEEQLKKTDRDIKLVLDCGAPNSPRGPEYLLQRYSREWKDFVDVIDVIEIGDGDHLRVVPVPKLLSSPSSSKEVDFLVKAKSTIEKIQKPAIKHAKVLGKVFPQADLDFDPHAECVSKEAHMKKKKFVGSPKSSHVTIVLLKRYQDFIPRGEARKKLNKDRIQTIGINRRMTSKVVKENIKRAFGCEKFITLDVAKGGRLVKSDKDLTAQVAIDRRGAVYLCEKDDFSESDSDFEDTPMSAAKRLRIKQKGKGKGKAICSAPESSDEDFEDTPLSAAKRLRIKQKGKGKAISVPESASSDDVIGSLKKPLLVSESDEEVAHNHDLEEFRRIRREQDEEFAVSLKIDQRKEEEKQKQKQKETEIENIRASVKDAVEKYSSTNKDDSLCVILPDSTRLVRNLILTLPMKVLYEVVFAGSEIKVPFLIYTRVGHTLISSSDTKFVIGELLKICRVLVVEMDEMRADPQVFFASLKAPLIQQEELLPDFVAADTEFCSIQHAEFERRKRLMNELDCEEGSPHLIKRDAIYYDVLELYSDFSKIIEEFPFRVAFDDENAVDNGGVSRDMFSGFWDVTFKKFFDGAGSQIPATHPSIDMSIFPTLGKILSHGYIVCGFLPVHISFPIIAAVLLGLAVDISEQTLRKSFIDYLNYCDASILKRAFQQTDGQYSPDLQSSLVALVGTYGCRKMPTRSNLSSLVTAIARHEFFVKPVGAIFAMQRGIPPEHQRFWAATTIEHLHDVYMASNADASTVLKVVREPLFKNPSEKCVYGFLIQYIGNLRRDGVRDFLRFVTGSSALVVDDINIYFNGLDGLSRRPMAHTCSCTLDLPTTYDTFTEFSAEFTMILADELSWIMDAM